jgi:hypothetical protein
MTLSILQQWIYYVRWSVRHTNFAATLRQGEYYIRGGSYSEGGVLYASRYGTPRTTSMNRS